MARINKIFSDGFGSGRKHQILIMKNSIGSKSRLITGISLLFVLLGFMNGCTKSTMYNTPSAGNMGSNGGSAPGANETTGLGTNEGG